MQAKPAVTSRCTGESTDYVTPWTTSHTPTAQGPEQTKGYIQ